MGSVFVVNGANSHEHQKASFLDLESRSVEYYLSGSRVVLYLLKWKKLYSRVVLRFVRLPPKISDSSFFRFLTM